MRNKIISRTKAIAEKILAVAVIIMLVSIVLMIPQIAEKVAKLLGTTKQILQASAFNTLLVGAGLALIVIAPMFVVPLLMGVVVVTGLILMGLGLWRLYQTIGEKPTDTGIFPDSAVIKKK